MEDAICSRVSSTMRLDLSERISRSLMKRLYRYILQPWFSLQAKASSDRHLRSAFPDGYQFGHMSKSIGMRAFQCSRAIVWRSTPWCSRTTRRWWRRPHTTRRYGSGMWRRESANECSRAIASRSGMWRQRNASR
ncbi:hypothetical protein FOPG_17479 [Fusarium oxysporum f. sp. conglutinans race 2 54008]|uniref:Uncharacterized protein n=1 Tax=Fusarium oxysporum f. sp. conglutinans race 2 54008 TaxID=1089457 RepID=X0GSN9_FUSOX|nr:hypothetical protein FOPG_17479 [Fusarium oxysporum f. sp. conglutinans race 2 54008]